MDSASSDQDSFSPNTDTFISKTLEFPPFEGINAEEGSQLFSTDTGYEEETSLTSGQGRLILKENDIILDNNGAEFKSAGTTYKINLNDFLFKKEIGRGMQGQIWWVTYKPADTEMAIKEIPLEMNDVQMKNILIELEVLSKNKSPYIIDFFGAFYTKSAVYICMEFMDLGSLNNMRRNYRNVDGSPRRIPDDVISVIIYSVISGLKFLSKALSIMHRDVKPSNIVVNSKGQVKLCDFGISGYLVKSGAKTYIGSMPYMAPERIIMKSSDMYTTQADVWSLGAAMVEFIMGKPLYALSGFDSAFGHLMAIANSPPPTISPSACSPELAGLLTKFLAKNPLDRPTFDQILEHPVIKTLSDLGAEVMEQIMKEFVLGSLPRTVFFAENPEIFVANY